MFKKLFAAIGLAGLLFITGFTAHKPFSNGAEPGAFYGEAPSLAAEGSRVHMSLASGDSIFYLLSTDKGKTFSTPALIGILPGLVNTGNRGPQIVCSNGGLLIGAPDTAGDFHTYIKTKTGSGWKKAARINDVPGWAKEGFLSLGAGGNGRLFATWLDLRNGEKNNIYGARSIDGGKTWLKNQLIYKSPEGAVCECCKPSVAISGQQVVVMFRNNLKGNRDLYIIQSKDGGASFSPAEKLGNGSWKLSGCPMDGGGLMIKSDKMIRAAWRREGDIYACTQGKPEILLTKGKQCTIAGSGESFYVSFIKDGKIYCRKPDGQVVELGQGGTYPKLLATGPASALCVWEAEHRVYRALL